MAVIHDVVVHAYLHMHIVGVLLYVKQIAGVRGKSRGFMVGEDL